MTDNQVDIQVKVTYEDGRTPVPQVKLELLDNNGVAQNLLFTDKDGRADFIIDLQISKTDNFNLRASGKSIEETVSDTVHVMHREGTHMVHMQVKSAEHPAPQSKSAITSVAQAQIPKGCPQRLSRRSERVGEEELSAGRRITSRKLLFSIPNTTRHSIILGMMYAHLDQPDKSRAAFETAVKLNDKNASADRNLAGLMLRDHNYQAAGDLARKSLAVDPNNSFAWTVAAISDFQTGNPDLYRPGLQSRARSPRTTATRYVTTSPARPRAPARSGPPPKLEYETYLKETPRRPRSPTSEEIPRPPLRRPTPASSKLAQRIPSLSAPYSPSFG